jgi:hypothetical protein
MDATKTSTTPPPYEPLGTDKLLSISAISDLLGVCPVTASRIMKESGRSITLHRRVFVLQSSFMQYMHELESRKVSA